MSAALALFRVLASVTSTFMILSPIPTMFRVVQERSTGHQSIIPLVSMLANCHMNLLYGYLIHNYFPIFATFLFGDVLSITYISLFYRFTDDRATAIKTIAYFVGPLALVTAYAAFGGTIFGQTQAEVGRIVGYLSIISTVTLYSAPFEKVGQVLKHRSAVFLNIHMIVAGAVTNSTWVIYSALDREWIVFAPNAFTVVAGLIQIAMYMAFDPRTHPQMSPPPLGLRHSTEHKLSPKEVDTLPALTAITITPSPATETRFVPIQSPA